MHFEKDFSTLFLTFSSPDIILNEVARWKRPFYAFPSTLRVMSFSLFRVF